jgi:hypothetical protein
MNAAVQTPAHLRLTPEQIRADWLAGFYTAQGYLYHLIRSLRRDGWWCRIRNIRQFCEHWCINRSTFYKAKAQLVANNLLEEHVLGGVDLRVPEPQGNTSAFPHPGEPTGEETAVGEAGEAEPHPPPQEDTAPGDEGEEAGIDPDFFRWVVQHKVPKLPQPPASPESAAMGWIRRYGSRLRSEYNRWRSRRQQPTTPPRGAPIGDPPDAFQLASAIDHALQQGDRVFAMARLQTYWVQGWHDPIEQLCLTNPHWQFAVTPAGIADGSSPPPAQE